MLNFLLRRMFFLVFVLIGVSILIFSIMMAFSPERRAAAYVDSPQQAEDIPRIIKRYGLDQPVYIQYFRWVGEVARGNLGYSVVAAQPVGKAFWSYLPVTLEMNLFAAPIILFLGIWMGTISGVHKDSLLDHGTRIVTVLGWSLPTFLFALLMLMVFYGYFGWFPPGVLSDQFRLIVFDPAGTFVRYTGLFTLDGLLNGRPDVTLDALKHLVLPVLTEVTVIVALNMRVMRSGIIEELSKDYITTVIAKGADSRTVNIRHAQRNALLPVITVAGQLAALSMEGSIAVEVVFNRSGIGWWLAESALQLDIPVIMCICLFMGAVFVFTNLVLDILYAHFDPRIRLA